jgi:uncharacterized protein YbjT (DUF2867 family)
MRVFVAGGNGVIGRYAVPALIAAGHTVSALARSDAKAEALRRQDATPVRVSLFDRDSLTTAFADHDAVVNLATALPPMLRRFADQPGSPVNGCAQRARPRSWTPREPPMSRG